MITTNPIALSTPTRFRVSFNLTPPYPKPESKVAGDGMWSVVCSVIARFPGDPVNPDVAPITVEGMHNIAPHPDERAPNPAGQVEVDSGVDMNHPPPGTITTPMPSLQFALEPVPHGEAGHYDTMWFIFTETGDRAWHVEVNIIHGTIDEVTKASQQKRSGCIIPWLPLPMADDAAMRAGDRLRAGGGLSFSRDVKRERQ